MSALNIKKAFDNTNVLSGVSDLTLLDKSSGKKLTNPPLSQFVLSGSQISDYETKPVEIFVDPFLTRGSLLLVSAKRGIGKTWFGLQLGISLSTGQFFLEYSVHKKRRVLYIDGEMRASDLKERTENLCNGNIPDRFSVLSSEVLAASDQSLNINNTEDQACINELLDEYQPDVMILDNLSSLRYGADENSNSDLDSLIKWFRQIRHKGIAVVIVHHAGKNGDVRGASRLEDILDYSIQLKELSSSSDGASFSINFTKCRGKKPMPLTLNASLVEKTNGYLEWKTSGYEKKATVQDEIIHQLATNQYKTQKELAEALNKDTGQLSKEIKKLKEKGLVTKNNSLKLSPAGEAHSYNIKGLFPTQELLDKL